MGRADGFRIGFSATCVGKKRDRRCLNGSWRPDHWFYAGSEGIGPGEMSAHRFLDSPHVTPEKVANHTVAACAGRRGLGPAGHDGKTPGCFCHAIVAVDVEDEVSSLWFTRASGHDRQPGHGALKTKNPSAGCGATTPDTMGS
jgi:hypothetical protein